MSDLTQHHQELTARRPWTAAEPESIWNISGLYPRKAGAFEDCLAVALPHDATGGAVLFKMIGALDDVIDPDWITHGRELILVEISNPSEAYFGRDQQVINDAKVAQ